MKQKLNTRSSTEGELVAANDMSTMILWTKLFMEAQGHEIKKNILVSRQQVNNSLGKQWQAQFQPENGHLQHRYCFSPTRLKKELNVVRPLKCCGLHDKTPSREII